MLPVTPLPPSTDLAYLLGVITGDGCITRAGRTYKLEIACDAAYPDLIECYDQLITRVTGLKVSTYRVRGRRCYRVVTWSTALPVILGIPSGSKAHNGYAIPEWIFEQTDFTKALVKGLIETDGAVARVFRHNGWYWHVHFTSSNSSIMQGFVRAVALLGYPFRIIGDKAILSKPRLSKELVQSLGISKLREYTYR